MRTLAAAFALALLAGTASADPGDISLQDAWARGPGDLPEGTVIARVGQVKVRELARCYRAALRLEPALAGDLFIRFELVRSARPSNVVIEGPTPELEACVRARVRRWKFAVPRDEDGRRSEMRFHFRFELG